MATQSAQKSHVDDVDTAPTPASRVDKGESLLLTREELTELCGTKQASRQSAWLDANDWPYMTALGKSPYPRVARAVFLEKMQRKSMLAAANEPRFDALDRFARLA
jgi:hypothetical protein